MRELFYLSLLLFFVGGGGSRTFRPPPQNFFPPSTGRKIGQKLRKYVTFWTNFGGGAFVNKNLMGGGGAIVCASFAEYAPVLNKPFKVGKFYGKQNVFIQTKTLLYLLNLNYI